MSQAEVIYRPDKCDMTEMNQVKNSGPCVTGTCADLVQRHPLHGAAAMMRSLMRAMRSPAINLRAAPKPNHFAEARHEKAPQTRYKSH